MSFKAVFRSKKNPRGDTGEKVGEYGGEAVEGTGNQGNPVGREGDLGTGRRAGSQDSSGCEGLGGRG